MFARLALRAKDWLAAPTDARLGKVLALATEMTARVPAERKKDWERLLAGLRTGASAGAHQAAARRRAHVEALVRACALFAAWIEPGDPVDRLPGLGPTSRAALAESGVHDVGDLVWTLPVAWDDLRAPLSVAEATARALEAQAKGERAARAVVVGNVKSASLIPMRGRRTVRVVLADEGDPSKLLSASWFFAAHGILGAAKVGSACLVVGRVRVDDKKRAQVAHPDIVADGPGARIVRARYPRIGAGEAALRKAIAAALDRLPRAPDPVPEAIATRERFGPCAPLLRAVHGKDGVLAEPPSDEARRALRERLAWAEAFTRVWERLSIEARQGKGGAPPLVKDRGVLARLKAELGFALTPGQSAAIDVIGKELARVVPMRRLLLGDVGTGKTAVALAAAAQCVSAGHQVAILAPTTVLAEQYMDAVAPLARATKASIALFSAGSGAVRKRAETQLAEGKIAVAIGTHALLSEGVRFERLGLVIVDEQHRLGVAQRLALVQKGVRPHLLTLSATPIPRTMALALRGELATSVLDERPKGRRPNATELRPKEELAAVMNDLRETCARGERAFFICPRIDGRSAAQAGLHLDDDDGEGDESPEGASARAALIAKELAPISVALVHGGLRPDAKTRAMRAFRSGAAQILVGTTVVEVGVDVPEATLMIILGAERFGLAQLHQLRGRVGRGDRPGRCILLHGALDPLAARRLDAVVTLATGTEIARADLALRGGGDLGGTRQSGNEGDLLYLDPGAPPPPWLGRVEADARAIFARDPRLESSAHAALARVVRRLAVAILVREEAG